MTYFEKVVERRRKKRAAAHRLSPLICNRRDSRIERDDPCALGGRQQRFRSCVAAFVEAGADSRPIKSCNPAGDAGVHQILSCKSILKPPPPRPQPSTLLCNTMCHPM